MSSAAEVEGGSGVVVDDAVAVAGGAVVDVRDAASCGAVPCDPGSGDFHLDRFVGADAFVGVGQGSDVFETDAFAMAVDVEAVIAGVLRRDVSNDDVRAGD